MSDYLTRNLETGTLKTLKDMGDGTYAEVIATGGQVVQAVPDFRDANDLLATYDNFSEVNWAGGDFVTLTKYSNGQAVTALSCNPIMPGESRVWLNVPVHQPAALEVEASVIRNRQQFATFTLFSNGLDDAPAPVPSPINITSIYQSNADNGAAYSAVAGTICTIVLETALPDYPSADAVYLSDWVNITGLVDTRLNYQNCAIKFISADRKTITFGFADEAALPSLAIAAITPTLGDAKVNFYNNMGGAAEGFGLRFTGTTATSAAIVSLFGNGDAQVSGTLFGDHRITIATTVPTYNNGVMGNVDLKASSRYRLEGRPSDCSVLDKAIESPTTSWTTRLSRTAVKPSIHLPLYPRFRVYQPVGMSRPVGEITTISKAGSTTWTVTTRNAHNLITGNYVTIKGNRDQTNFAAFATPVAVTVTGANTFTLIGTTGTATGYGGSVCLINGGSDQPGIIGQAISSIAQYSVNTDWLSVVGNTTWSGVSIGDYIHIYGAAIDLTGADAAIDGAWEVASLATSTMLLKPITSVLGVRVSPTTPALGTTPVNAGGSVILRTTARMHDLMLEDWSETKVMIDGQGTARVDKAMPVAVLSMPNTTVTLTSTTVAGTVAVDAAIGNPVTAGLRASNANITAMSASGDNVGWLGTMIGAGIVRPYSLPEADWTYTGTLTTNADTAAKAAAGAGIKNYCTAIQVQNTHATVATTFIIKDGTTARFTINLPAAMTMPVDIEFPTPIPTAANAVLNVACGTTGANVLVNAQGYFAP
jgi:hypothetical protein